MGQSAFKLDNASSVPNYDTNLPLETLDYSQLEAIPLSPTEQTDVNVFYIKQYHSNIYIKTIVSDTAILAMIDTGSVKNCLSYDTFLKLRLDVKLQNSHEKFKTATGTPIITHGTIETYITIDNTTHTINFTVCEINESIILGDEFLSSRQIVIDYNKLRLMGPNIDTPIYRTSNTDLKTNVINLDYKTIHYDGVIVCTIDRHIELPGTYTYEPNVQLWGPNAQPVVINLLNDHFELKVKGQKDFNLYLPKNTVIGTLREVSVNNIQHELNTMNMSKDDRLELIVQQVKLEDNKNLTHNEKLKVKELLGQYHDIFSLSKKEMSFCTIFTLSLIHI